MAKVAFGSGGPSSCSGDRRELLVNITNTAPSPHACTSSGLSMGVAPNGSATSRVSIVPITAIPSGSSLVFIPPWPAADPEKVNGVKRRFCGPSHTTCQRPSPSLTISTMGSYFNIDQCLGYSDEILIILTTKAQEYHSFLGVFMVDIKLTATELNLSKYDIVVVIAKLL